MIFISQAEQANGYWLIMVKLEPHEPTTALPFGYEISVNNQSWVLFSQTGNKASFLSYSKCQNKANFELIYSHKTAFTYPPWALFNEKNTFFNPSKTYLLLASDLRMAGVFHLLKELKGKSRFIVLLHATDSFPCIVKPAQIMFHNFPHEAIGSCPLLEDWKLVNRLCSSQGLPGCFDGDFKELFKVWTPPTDWEILDFGYQ